MVAIYPFLKSVYKESKTNIDEIVVTLILITLPLGGYAINSSMVILFFLISIYRFFKSDKKPQFSILSFLFIAFYLWCCLSLIWTNSMPNTLIGLERFLSFLVLPLAFSINYKKIRLHFILDKYAKSMTLFALYCIIMGGLKAFKNNDITYLFYHNLSGNLSQLNAIYLSVFVSLAIGFFLFNAKKTKSTLFLILFLSVFLVLLSSKIIISVTVIYCFFYILKTNIIKIFKPKHLKIIISIGLLFLISSSNLVKRFKTEYEKTKIEEVLQKKDFGPIYLWTGVGLRVFQTKVFFEILSEKKRIFLGSGLNNSQKDLNNKYREYNLYHGFLNFNYHNQYLQVFAELGIVGFSFFILILYLVLKKSIFEKDYFALFFIIIILSVCFTETLLWRQRGMVCFLTISILIFNHKKLQN